MSTSSKQDLLSNQLSMPPLAWFWPQFPAVHQKVSAWHLEKEIRTTRQLATVLHIATWLVYSQVNKPVQHVQLES